MRERCCQLCRCCRRRHRCWCRRQRRGRRRHHHQRRRRHRPHHHPHSYIIFQRSPSPPEHSYRTPSSKRSFGPSTGTLCSLCSTATAHEHCLCCHSYLHHYFHRRSQIKSCSLRPGQVTHRCHRYGRSARSIRAFCTLRNSCKLREIVSAHALAFLVSSGPLRWPRA